jgi:biopolymer transport protein TolR
MAGRVSSELDDMAEINVTPLVDVMLVLLIIFIITAPMLVQGLSVNLPRQDAPAIDTKGIEPLTITVTSDRVILLGTNPFTSNCCPNGWALSWADRRDRCT